MVWTALTIICYYLVCPCQSLLAPITSELKVSAQLDVCSYSYILVPARAGLGHLPHCITVGGVTIRIPASKKS